MGENAEKRDLIGLIEELGKDLKKELVEYTTALKYKGVYTYSLPRKKTKAKSAPTPKKWIVNPLEYLLSFHKKYAELTQDGTKVLFVGMNPAPDSSTGIPFYNKETFQKVIEAPKLNNKWKNVLDWLGKKEVTSKSGKRFWKLMKQCGSCKEFFAHCFVINYCPLIFMDAGRNNIPLDDKLSQDDLGKAVKKLCDKALRDTILILKPKLIVAVGNFAHSRGFEAIECDSVRHRLPELQMLRIYHPAAAISCSNWLNVVREGLEKNRVWQEILILAKMESIVLGNCRSQTLRIKNGSEIVAQVYITFKDSESYATQYKAYMTKFPEKTKTLFVCMDSLTGRSLLEEAMDANHNRQSTINENPFWNYMMKKFGSMEEFFRHCFIINYSSLVIKAEGGHEIDAHNWGLDDVHHKFASEVIRILKPKSIIIISNCNGLFKHQGKELPVLSFKSAVGHEETDQTLLKDQNWRNIMILGILKKLRSDLELRWKNSGELLCKPRKSYRRENVTIAGSMNVLKCFWEFIEEYFLKMPKDLKILFVCANPCPDTPVEALTSKGESRFWNFVDETFSNREAFLKQCFLYNYCPLILRNKSGKSVNLDSLLRRSKRLKPQMAPCDSALKKIIHITKPKIVVGIGDYVGCSVKNALEAPELKSVKSIRFPHPSPELDKSSEDWRKKVDKKLRRVDAWKKFVEEIRRETETGSVTESQLQEFGVIRREERDDTTSSS